MKNLIRLSLAITALAPFAALGVDAGGIQSVGQSSLTLKGLIDAVTGWATGLLIALSVLFVIYAAFLYLTAAGNEKNVETAKNIIIYAVIAIVIALMAQVVKTVATQLVGVQAP